MQVLAKVWRRLGRTPGLESPIRITEDLTKGLLFDVNSKRQVLYENYQNCQTSKEFYDLSRLILGAHQIEQEIIGFLELARLENPHYICEIGTADGGTNFLLSQALPSVKVMLGLDLYVRNRRRLQAFSKPNQQLHYFNGSSYTEAILSKVKHTLAGNLLDILFIDGDHRYEGVRADFLMYRQLVRDNGLIVFHDIVTDYSTRFGKPTGNWVGGVPTFWQQVKSLYSTTYEFIADPNQDGFGIGVVQYSSSVELPADF